MKQKLTPEQFVYLAIEKLAPTGKQTIHTVFSGFNEAFKKYFEAENLDPVEEVKKLVGEGKVDHRLTRGGAIIGKPGAIPARNSGADALKKMGASLGD